MMRVPSDELSEDDVTIFTVDDRLEHPEIKSKASFCRIWLKCLSLTTIILALIALLVISILGFAILPYIWGYHSWEYQLTRYGKIWKHFMNPENPTIVKIYIYQVDDYEKFYKNHTGEPTVYARGPFVFRKHRRILHATLDNEKDTVTFRAQTKYFFDAKRSNMSERYIINTFNVPLLIMLSLNSTKPRGQLLKDGALRDKAAFGFERYLVLQKGISVRDFLFDGQPFCQTAKNFQAKEMCDRARTHLVAKNHNSFFRKGGGDTLLFSVLGSRQNSDEGKITLCLGSKSDTKDKTGFISAINGQEELNVWPKYLDSTCNKIDGFYSFFPVVTKFYKEFYIYVPELCSKFKFVRVNDSGTNTRYEVDMDSLVGNEKGFQCHGTDGTIKDIDDTYRLQLEKGATDLTKCLGGYPFIWTLPYFGLPEKYREQKFLVDKDTFKNQKWYLEIDYLNETGVCVKMVIKVQFNLFIRREEGIEVFQDLKKTAVVPIFLYEESLTYTREEYQDSVQQMSEIYGKRADHQLNLARYIAIGLCAFLVLLGCCMLLIQRCYNRVSRNETETSVE